MIFCFKFIDLTNRYGLVSITNTNVTYKSGVFVARSILDVANTGKLCSSSLRI